MPSLEHVLEQEKRILAEIHSNIQAIASVIGFPQQREAEARVAYASSPITTGPRMYDAFAQHTVSSVAELNNIDPELFKKHIMQANIRDGKRFWNAICGTATYNYVICPATFFAKNWAQEHYMNLWERVIETFCTAIHFNDGWNLSNGCAEEYLIGLRTGKSLYEGPTQQPLPPERALQLLKEGIDQVICVGADPKALIISYGRIETAAFAKKQDVPI